MAKERVYLAGPMSGIKDFNFPAFFRAEEQLTEAGYDVFNPAAHDVELFGADRFETETGDRADLPAGFDLAETLANDLRMVAVWADSVVVLPGWENSKGAKAEVSLAQALGKRVGPLHWVADAEQAYPRAWYNEQEVRGQMTGVVTHPSTADFLGVDTPSIFASKENALSVAAVSRADMRTFASGETRTVSSTGGAKGVKLARYDLIPADALEELANHYGRGALKYSDGNWLKGYEWSKNFAALMRHAWAFWRGEDIDEETGTPHIIAAAWHCFALYTFSSNEKYVHFDDRVKSDA